MIRLVCFSHTLLWFRVQQWLKMDPDFYSITLSYSLPFPCLLLFPSDFLAAKLDGSHEHEHLTL